MAEDKSFDALSSTSIFSNKFLKAVSTVKGNLVSSPLSCQMALAMLYPGSKGKTANCLSKALCLPKNVETACEEIGKLISKMKDSKDAIELQIASEIFMKKGLAIHPAYTKALGQSFGASGQTVDFLDKRAAAGQINKWAAENTRNKIMDVVAPGSFDEMTSMVLVNTIYFKGLWQKPFRMKATTERHFFTDETKKIKVHFMTQTEKMQYAKLEDFDAQLLQLFYKGFEYSLVIVVPNKKTGLALLEEKLMTSEISELLKRAQYKNIELFLPKFKIETTLDLEKALGKIGLKHLFTETADFSGITVEGEEPTFISDVVQKACIEVNEEGTIAAAVTSGRTIEKGRHQPPITVDCNRPFAFMLVYQSKLALFGGRVTLPST